MAKGRFIPKNPQKYVGDPNKIMFRSSWEIAVMKFLDTSSAVMKWGSEELAIPYIKPTDGRVHQYYPDFIVAYTDAAGNVQREIWEVKPLKESLAEQANSVHDKVALAINEAKWKSASLFAQQHGMAFKVMTERSLFRQGTKKQTKKPRTTRKTK